MRVHGAPLDLRSLRVYAVTEVEKLIEGRGVDEVTAARSRLSSSLPGFDIDSTLSATDGEVFSLITMADTVASRLADEAVFDGYVAAHESTAPFLAAVPGTGADQRSAPEDVVRTPRGDAQRSTILPAAMASSLQAGRTFIIHRVDQYDLGALRVLVEDLERCFGVLVGVNCYLSHNESEGFGRHWDDHDVVVVQVRGRKLWEVFEPAHLSPLNGYIGEDASGRTAWSGVVRPGQCLVIPRGWPHRAVGLDELSVHYTIGLHRPTFLEALDMIAALGGDPPSEQAPFRAWLEAAADDGARLAATARAAHRAEVPTRPRGSLVTSDAWLQNRGPLAAVRVLLPGPPAFLGEPSDDEVRVRWSGLDVYLDIEEARLLAGWPDLAGAPVADARRFATGLLESGLARLDSVPIEASSK